MKQKYPLMPNDVRIKLYELRIRGKMGQLNREEQKYCSDAFIKYGEKQYDSVISEKEVFDKTKPFSGSD